MTSTATFWCRACGAVAQPGALLRVEPVDGSPPFTVHRPGVRFGCFTVAGPATSTSISFQDEFAARTFDRATGGRP